jgi:hypothetical protein
MADDRRQFSGVPVSGGAAPRVVVRGGQGGGEEMPEGILGVPLRPSPHGNPGPTSVSASVRNALPKLTPSLAAGVLAVVRKK